MRPRSAVLLQGAPWHDTTTAPEKIRKSVYSPARKIASFCDGSHVWRRPASSKPCGRLDAGAMIHRRIKAPRFFFFSRHACVYVRVCLKVLRNLVRVRIRFKNFRDRSRVNCTARRWDEGEPRSAAATMRGARESESRNKKSTRKEEASGKPHHQLRVRGRTRVETGCAASCTRS